MAPSEETHHQAFDDAVLTDDHLLDLEHGLLELRRLCGLRTGASRHQLRLPFGGEGEDVAAVEHETTNASVKPRCESSAAPTPVGTLNPVRVLVVEDEADLAQAVATGLRREGYAVDVAHDGEEALEKLGYTEYDLICLDLTLPRVDGTEVCRRIRSGETASTAARVLMLTARDGVVDRIAGLDQGADDYLIKPYAFAELTARIRTLLRRDAGRSGAVLRVGDLTLDTARLLASRGDRDLDLTAKEFALLRYFMTREGEVLSTEDLLEHVWDEFTDPFTNTVRVTVGTLRRKLSADGEPPLIETLIGSGYRLLDRPR
jgi:DNA-binding response OmpR family regulator